MCADVADSGFSFLCSLRNFFDYLFALYWCGVVLFCGVPSFTINDVQGHTLGEARWGAGKGHDDFILLAAGTGIGGAVVADGKLLKGYHGYAGELGHIQISLKTDVKCPCGGVGHLEGVASGSGIENCYEELTGTRLTGPEISKLANDGDMQAKEVIETAGFALGGSIGMLLSVFDPEIIVLTGSVTKAGKIWEDALYRGYNKEANPTIKDNLKIVSAKLGDPAAVYGACENTLDMIEQNNN